VARHECLAFDLPALIAFLKTQLRQLSMHNLAFILKGIAIAYVL